MLSGIVLIGQLFMFWRQLGIMKASMNDTKAVSEAAKLSANAAVAALDRPWLFVNKPMHNQNAWIAGDGALSVMFSLTNYGKAPAIIHSIKGVIFASPGRGTKVSEIGLATMDVPTILDFPASNDLQTFMNDRARTPREVDGIVPFRAKVGAVDIPVHKKKSAAYVVPYVVGGSDSSPEFWIAGTMPFAQPDKGIPLESAMNIYFIGTILYNGPDEEIQMLNFCYESPPLGEFKVFRGRPYNERRKSIQ